MIVANIPNSISIIRILQESRNLPDIVTISAGHIELLWVQSCNSDVPSKMVFLVEVNCMKCNANSLGNITREVSRKLGSEERNWKCVFKLNKENIIVLYFRIYWKEKKRTYKLLMPRRLSFFGDWSGNY